MPKDNLQLISARIDAETIQKIEKFTERHSYWKRNSVINNLLMTIFRDFSDKQIYDMVRRSNFKDQCVRVDYEICDYVQNITPKP